MVLTTYIVSCQHLKDDAPAGRDSTHGVARLPVFVFTFLKKVPLAGGPVVVSCEWAQVTKNTKAILMGVGLTNLGLSGVNHHNVCQNTIFSHSWKVRISRNTKHSSTVKHTTTNGPSSGAYTKRISSSCKQNSHYMWRGLCKPSDIQKMRENRCKDPCTNNGIPTTSTSTYTQWYVNSKIPSKKTLAKSLYFFCSSSATILNSIRKSVAL